MYASSSDTQCWKEDEQDEQDLLDEPAEISGHLGFNAQHQRQQDYANTAQQNARTSRKKEVLIEVKEDTEQEHDSHDARPGEADVRFG